MITCYIRANGGLVPTPLPEAGNDLPAETIWIDMLDPTEQERHLIDEALGLAMPKKEIMKEIEPSSRLYQAGEAAYLTVVAMTAADTLKPRNEPVTFVLTRNILVTLRYADPQPFRNFIANLRRHTLACSCGEDVMASLCDAVVARVADILEKVNSETDDISGQIFHRDRISKPDYDEVLRKVGRNQTVTVLARDSLVSLARVVTYMLRPVESKLQKQTGRAFKTVSRDISSLSDQASFLSSNLTFLLDATLGLINSEQNGIIKIFSVAAVVFLPPTLIASIYGMNFKDMPELDWLFGYPFALGLMVASAVFTYVFFRRKGWL
ncbi:magnesium transporter [Parvibaculum indicum]|uniref:magnesium transporter CorA family protein n=1 Tax=Parvibaculum indicum TaxID=562969 RepID=UPI00141F10AE|nr:magnesium transporter CorA family protein [Parvibaculum indicum]NIJ41066.1 magnesium transporter [Parvibaculum indicum]